MNIYVSVGTHEQPFQRLLDSVADAIRATDDHRWIVQFGVGSWRASGERVLRSVDYFTPEEVAETLQWADVIVSQASPGNVFGALEVGVWPLVLGRRRAHGEHVDDHQVHFASALASMGLATDIVDAGRLRDIVESTSRISSADRAARIEAGMRSSSARQAQFRDETWALILGQQERLR